ncbi:hypothetical protein [Kitasatospora sp. NBC_01302]|uniref:hypothetical protein n=1 Tax=Kitasatospora sp. NBC_01302 TaxID=2903575 RepID=UPI002E1232A2|nr:hypothetical protein OG294_13865 [Kitasatospora sp. NBC_01302]
MATYTHQERTVRHIEYLVPVPVAYAEVCKAIVAAERSLKRARGLAVDAALSDDALTVTVTDDAVVIAYTVDVDLPTTS